MGDLVGGTDLEDLVAADPNATESYFVSGSSSLARERSFERERQADFFAIDREERFSGPPERLTREVPWELHRIQGERKLLDDGAQRVVQAQVQLDAVVVLDPGGITVAVRSRRNRAECLQVMNDVAEVPDLARPAGVIDGDGPDRCRMPHWDRCTCVLACGARCAA